MTNTIELGEAYPRVSNSVPVQSATPEALLKVLHVIAGLYYGGGQRVVLDLAEVTPQVAKMQCRIAALGGPVGAMAEASPIVVPYCGRYNKPRVVFKTAAALGEVIDEVKPDIVHTHGWDADVIAALARRGRSAAQVIHLHDTRDWLASRQLKHGLRRWFTNRMLRPPRTYPIAVSAAVRKYMCQTLAWDDQSVQVIHNGIALDQYASVSPRSNGDPLVLGLAARLASMKGIVHLLGALALLRDRGVHVDLKLAGEGPSRDQLQQRALELKLTDRVHFLGHRSDVSAFLREIDLLVLPSIGGEGLPLVVLEAMASGLPVIATRCAGIPEVVEHERTGLLVEMRDETGLATAIERLVSDAALRKALADCGHERAMRLHSRETMARRVAEVYERAAREAMCR